MTEKPRRSGVLLMGYGGPDSLDAVGPFMCNLTGREPSEEVLNRVCMRYLAIGGESPLPGIASAIADALQTQLLAEHGDVPVAVGMRYWHPYISEALAALAEQGVERVIGVSLSPFEAKITSGAYREAVEEALAAYPGLEFVEAPSIALTTEFAEFVAASAVSSIDRLEDSPKTLVVFTAHSLPESDLAEDDPYVSGLRDVVEQSVGFLGWGHGIDGVGEPVLPGVRTYGNLASNPAWVFAYQSAGNKPGPWLGPDIEDVIDAAVKAGYRAVVAVPVGFVTDHMETLYDLDIEAADRAISQDIEFVRGPVPNEHEHLIKGIVSLVKPLL